MTVPSPSIAERLVAAADRQPEAPFLHRPDMSDVRYGALAGQIRYVRERLRSWGIVPGDIVAGFERSRALMAMACASLPASSTFAPLGSTLATDAYVALLRRMRPKAVFAPPETGHPLRIAAATLGVPAMCAVPGDAGSFALEIEPGVRNAVEPLARPEHAYVLVTSGTTGRPKLAPLGHRQMLDYADAMIDLLRLGPDDVGYALAPFHFAGGLRSSILIPSLAGASFVCLEESDVDGFFRTIDEFRPTNLAAPFSIHRAVLRRAAEFPHQVASSRLRFLRTTAGRLDPDESEALERLFRAPVLQGFGSTEVCGIAHEPMPPRPRKRGSVGIPVGGDVRAMDVGGRTCGPSETGELVVRGPLVFDGYLDDADLTARSFTGEWFRTGDLGHVDEDGYVFVTGRLAELINRGGEKISPVEVDRAIEALPGVREAGTFGVPHPTLGEELVAAVVLEPGATIGAAEILAQVRDRLGPRQMPRHVYVVDALPRTDAGKLRRRALPEWVGIDVDRPTTVPERPRDGTPLESALAGLWSAVLRRDHVGRDDNFFLLGGDSMSAAELVRQVAAVFGVNLPLHAMFEGTATPAGMARAIVRSRSGARP